MRLRTPPHNETTDMYVWQTCKRDVPNGGCSYYAIVECVEERHREPRVRSNEHAVYKQHASHKQKPLQCLATVRCKELLAFGVWSPTALFLNFCPLGTSCDHIREYSEEHRHHHKPKNRKKYSEEASPWVAERKVTVSGPDQMQTCAQAAIRLVKSFLVAWKPEQRDNARAKQRTGDQSKDGIPDSRNGARRPIEGIGK